MAFWSGPANGEGEFVEDSIVSLPFADLHLQNNPRPVTPPPLSPTTLTYRPSATRQLFAERTSPDWSSIRFFATDATPTRGRNTIPNDPPAPGPQTTFDSSVRRALFPSSNALSQVQPTGVALNASDATASPSSNHQSRVSQAIPQASQGDSQSRDGRSTGPSPTSQVADTVEEAHRSATESNDEPKNTGNQAETDLTPDNSPPSEPQARSSNLAKQGPSSTAPSRKRCRSYASSDVLAGAGLTRERKKHCPTPSESSSSESGSIASGSASTPPTTPGESGPSTSEAASPAPSEEAVASRGAEEDPKLLGGDDANGSRQPLNPSSTDARDDEAEARRKAKGKGRALPGDETSHEDEVASVHRDEYDNDVQPSTSVGDIANHPRHTIPAPQIAPHNFSSSVANRPTTTTTGLHRAPALPTVVTHDRSRGLPQQATHRNHVRAANTHAQTQPNGYSHRQNHYAQQQATYGAPGYPPLSQQMTNLAVSSPTQYTAGYPTNPSSSAYNVAGHYNQQQLPPLHVSQQSTIPSYGFSQQQQSFGPPQTIGGAVNGHYQYATPSLPYAGYPYVYPNTNAPQSSVGESSPYQQPSQAVGHHQPGPSLPVASNAGPQMGILNLSNGQYSQQPSQFIQGNAAAQGYPPIQNNNVVPQVVGHPPINHHTNSNIGNTTASANPQGGAHQVQRPPPAAQHTSQNVTQAPVNGPAVGPQVPANAGNAATGATQNPLTPFGFAASTPGASGNPHLHTCGWLVRHPQGRLMVAKGKCGASIANDVQSIKNHIAQSHKVLTESQTDFQRCGWARGPHLGATKECTHRPKAQNLAEKIRNLHMGPSATERVCDYPTCLVSTGRDRRCAVHRDASW